MKETRVIMGMPIIVHIVNDDMVIASAVIDKVFRYFRSVDERFSLYKKDSEISLINQGKIDKENYSRDMREIMRLAEETRSQTDGYFDIRDPDGFINTSGIVKGWAIYKASLIIRECGIKNYFINAGGDIELGGVNEDKQLWRVGIEDPLHLGETTRILSLTDCGIATSGTYIRGDHIYNPKTQKKNEKMDDGIRLKSITIIGPNVYEADRFATPAFVMGENAIAFIEKQKGLEGYIIDTEGREMMTKGFSNYLAENK